jgi:hypothetical protein
VTDSSDLALLTDEEAEEHEAKQEAKRLAVAGLELRCLHCPWWRGTKLQEQRDHIRTVHGITRKTKNMKVCQQCGEGYVGTKTQKFCSLICRKKAAHART